MVKKLIDEVEDLMLLSDDDLDEILIEERYNKVNLRELVRRSLKVATNYKNAFNYEVSQTKKDTDEYLKQFDRE